MSYAFKVVMAITVERFQRYSTGFRLLAVFPVDVLFPLMRTVRTMTGFCVAVHLKSAPAVYAFPTIAAAMVRAFRTKARP